MLVLGCYYSPVPRPQVMVSVNTTGPLLTGDSLSLTCLVTIPRHNDIDAVQSIVPIWDGPRVVPGERDTLGLSECGQGMFVSVLTISRLTASQDSGEFVCSVLVKGVQNTLDNTTGSDAVAIDVSNTTGKYEMCLGNYALLFL